MNGYIGQLNVEQKAILEQIREDLSEVLTEEHDDRFLLRFLRARSFNKEDTEKMLRTHLRWRKHFSVEYFTKEYKPPEFCDKYLRMAVLGFTNEGNLIRILRLGYSDAKGMLLATSSLDVEIFLAYVITTDRYLMEMNREQTAARAESVIYIGDFEGLNVYEFPWKFTLSILIRLVKTFEANFPEHLKAVHLINCPTVVYYVLKALKPFMSEVTASKVNIFGSEGYKDLLLENINPQILPDFLGGVRYDTEDDNTVEYLGVKAGKIPESSYIFNARRLTVTEPGVIQVQVERRKTICIDVEVSEDDCAVRWEVDVKEHDLGLGFFIRENSDSAENLKCIKPVRRHKSHFSPFVGMHICEHPGKYVLMMDNSYSYFTDKIALYRITVKPARGSKR